MTKLLTPGGDDNREGSKVNVADPWHEIWTKSLSVHFLNYCSHLKVSQEATPELNMWIVLDYLVKQFPPKTSNYPITRSPAKTSPNPKQYFIPSFLQTCFFFSFSFLFFFLTICFSCHTVITTQMMHFYFLHLVGTEKEKWLKTCGVE